MSAEEFVDTNVLLYLLSTDLARIGSVETIIRSRPVISTQVLSEFVAVTRRKFKMKWGDVRTALAPIRAACSVVPVTITTHELALDVAENHALGLYDAQIVAAASLAGCRTILTEDLNPGQIIAGVRVRNPLI
jgi:predicted nucleic acid-binding protein